MVAAEFGSHHQVGRRADQGKHAADKRSNGDRHQQPGRADVHFGGQIDGHRNEDGDRADVVHEGREPRHHQHEHDQEAGFAGPGHLHDPGADAVEHPGAEQALRDDEQSGDEQDQRIPEAGQGFGGREHLAEHESQHHQNGYHVQGQKFAGEQDNGDRQQDKYE